MRMAVVMAKVAIKSENPIPMREFFLYSPVKSEQVYKWTSEQVYKRTSGRAYKDEWTSLQEDRWASGRVDK